MKVRVFSLRYCVEYSVCSVVVYGIVCMCIFLSICIDGEECACIDARVCEKRELGWGMWR